jgi:hypothetical protein
MAGDRRVTHPDGARSARGGFAAVGLIAAPDIPERIAKEIATDLRKLLGRHVDDRVSWNVSVVVDPLTGTDREAPEILDVCHGRLRQEGWDLAVCLTDLPVYRSGRLVVADVSAQRKVGSLSLPALGRRACCHGRERRPSKSSASCTPGARRSPRTTLPLRARRAMTRQMPGCRVCPDRGLTTWSAAGSPSSQPPSGGSNHPTRT